VILEMKQRIFFSPPSKAYEKMANTADALITQLREIL